MIIVPKTIQKMPLSIKIKQKQKNILDSQEIINRLRFKQEIGRN